MNKSTLAMAVAVGVLAQQASATGIYRRQQGNIGAAQLLHQYRQP
ncbi:hypothetical protein OKW11_002738 [Pseudomonas baetica]|nr:hypothetical protein [Pseudomonas baetica]